MTFMYLNQDQREQDFWLGETAAFGAIEVDLSEEFIQRYRDAVDNYDGIQAELDLIYKSREVN